MATIELPDDVAQAVGIAQQKLADSMRESQEALTARDEAERAGRNAEVQMAEANVASQEATAAGLAALDKVRAYLKLPPTP